MEQLLSLTWSSNLQCSVAENTHLQEQGCPLCSSVPSASRSPHNSGLWITRGVGHWWMETKIHPKTHSPSHPLARCCIPQEDGSFLWFAQKHRWACGSLQPRGLPGLAPRKGRSRWLALLQGAGTAASFLLLYCPLVNTWYVFCSSDSSFFFGAISQCLERILQRSRLAEQQATGKDENPGLCPSGPHHCTAP